MTARVRERVLRRRRLLGLAAVAAAVGVVVLLHAVLTGRTTQTRVDRGADIDGPSTVSDPGPTVTSAPEALAPLRDTDDPARFARAVAQAVFEWDTAAGFNVEVFADRLVAVADPTGVETPGLVADLSLYLPTVQEWANLRRYSTRQWLEVSVVERPGLWPQAVADAPNGSLAPGTTAYTVTGVRHRAGVWEGRPVTSEHDVAFTVFMVCGPSYDACRLLRLSRLDEPLR